MCNMDRSYMYSDRHKPIVRGRRESRGGSNIQLTYNIVYTLCDNMDYGKL